MDFTITVEGSGDNVKSIITFHSFEPSRSTLISLKNFLKLKGKLLPSGLGLKLDGDISESKVKKIMKKCEQLERKNRIQEDDDY